MAEARPFPDPFAADPMSRQVDDFLDDDRGFLDLQPSQGSQINESRPAIPVSSGQYEARSGRTTCKVAPITSANIQSLLGVKSRTAALRFDSMRVTLVGDFADYAHRMAEKIQVTYKAVTFGFGFPLNYYTFFPVERGDLWVVLAALYPINMKKWHKVFEGLDAAEIVAPHVVRDSRAGVQESLVIIADIFRGTTTIEELARNRVECSDTLRRQPGAATNAGPKKRGRNDPLVARANEGLAPPAQEQPLRAQPSPRRRARTGPEEEPSSRSALVGRTTFVYDAEVMSNACLRFLQRQVLSDAGEIFDMLTRHLDQSKKPEYGHIGRFLLSARPLEQFARVVHLRHAVHCVLQARYGMRVGSLAGTAVMAAQEYQHISVATRERLHLIGRLFESKSCVPIYSFLDPTCILAFLSVYVVEQYVRVSVDKAQREKDFFNCFLCPVLEQVWWFTAAACRMSSFLHVQIAEGFAIPDWCGPLMYGSHVDERAALAESLQEFPTMANAVEMNPNKDFMLSQRSSFWRAKLPSMVARIKKASGLKEFGVAVEMLLVMQENTGAFCDMLPDHPGYRCLPSTRFSDDPGMHVQGLGSPMRLTEHICRARSVCH